MPELPEVQTIVAELRSAGIIGRKITGSIIRWPPLIKGRSVSGFKKMIHGSRIRDITRRGKFIVITLSNRLFLLVHLRMSGQFNLVAAGRKREPHQHIILQFGDKRELRYRDTRKFGRWQLVADPAKTLATLGPEPLEKSFKPAGLIAILKACRRQLKPLLLDQKKIAGLGNIYVDEALWEARLHPRRLSNSLDERESSALYAAIRCVLRRAIRNKGTSLGTGIGNYSRLGEKTGRNQNKLKVARHGGASCPRCAAAISRMLVGQRATYVCVKCQKLETERSGSRRSESRETGN